MRKYKQLTQEQRYQIYILRKSGVKQEQIASLLGYHKSTISRELKRNSGLRGYRPKQAHDFAITRKTKNAKSTIPQSAWELVEHLVKNDWSPEQIATWLKLIVDVSISHEWIYQYLLRDKKSGGKLFKHLRCQKKRKKRYGSAEVRGQLKNRRSIDLRPKIVETRSRLGDWEVDTIVSKGRKYSIVSATERKSRMTLIEKVKGRSANVVKEALLKLLLPISSLVHTITADNGKEFADHEEIAEKLNADFFFAKPYAAWQRGTNENANGLIRQYFPKKRVFKDITATELDMVMKRLNNRPRKVLGFKTPDQVFFGHNQVALTS